MTTLSSEELQKLFYMELKSSLAGLLEKYNEKQGLSCPGMNILMTMMGALSLESSTPLNSADLNAKGSKAVRDQILAMMHKSKREEDTASITEPLVKRP